MTVHPYTHDDRHDDRAELAGRLVVALAPTPDVRQIVARRILEFADELADDQTLGEILVNLEDPTSSDLAARAGVTYRQIHYWTSEGYIPPPLEGPGGSGHPRRYPRQVIVKARIMGALVRMFAIAPARASELADQIITDGQVRLGSFTLTRDGLGS